jgi:hypothetical protein
MLNRAPLLGLVFVTILAVGACAPAEEPQPSAGETPAPPPPPPAVYDLGDVDVVAEEPAFTSFNVSFSGVKLMDVTNEMGEALGEPSGTTENRPEHYLTYYRNGGLLIFTFKATGEIRKIEILSRLADEVASPQIRAWLEDGDLESMRAIMGGPEEYIDTGEAQDTDEYVYDERGIRFIKYPEENGIRFSYYRR